MIVIDASVWISFYLPQDVNHSATVPFMRRIVQGGVPMFAPGLVLVEVGAALARRVGEDNARQAVAHLQRMPYLRLSNLDARAVVRATQIAIDGKLCGTDAVYVALAQRLGLPLVSWDGEHRALAGVYITVYTPSTAP